MTPRYRYMRAVALFGTSWRALSTGFAPLTREEWERALIASGRALGLIRLR